MHRPPVERSHNDLMPAEQSERLQDSCRGLKNRTMTDSAISDITSDSTHDIALEIGRQSSSE